MQATDSRRSTWRSSGRRLDDVSALIAAGEITDAKTIIGLLMARDRLIDRPSS